MNYCSDTPNAMTMITTHSFGTTVVWQVTVRENGRYLGSKRRAIGHTGSVHEAKVQVAKALYRLCK